MKEAAEFEAAVGKTFKIKNADGSLADRRFRIAKLIPKVDFGGKRGKQPAFEVERLDAVGHHMPPAAEFLEQHEEVVENES